MMRRGMELDDHFQQACKSSVCPTCGSGDSGKAPVDRDTFVIVPDRICRQCGTRYRPPPPLWTPVGVFIAGLFFLAVFVGLLYDHFVAHFVLKDLRLTWWGIIGCVGWVVIGLGFVASGIFLAYDMWFRKR